MPRNDQDRVLWTLTEHGGSMAKSNLARRLQTRQTELDVVFQELGRFIHVGKDGYIWERII